MPDTIPSPAVGDIAEIDWVLGDHGGTALVRWNGRAWRDLDYAQHFTATEVTAVRPLRLVDADAVVIDVADNVKMLRETLCAAQAAVNRAEPGRDIGRRREHSDRLQRLINECSRHRPTGSDGKHGNRHTPTCGCEDKPAAVVPDEGGGGGGEPLAESTTCHQPQSGTTGDGPLPGDGWLDSYIRSQNPKSEPPVLDVRVDAPSELRTDEDRAFVLRTVADEFERFSDFDGLVVAFRKAADRLLRLTTGAGAGSGVSGELSGTEEASAFERMTAERDLWKRFADIDHDSRNRAVAELVAARAEAARYKAAVEAMRAAAYFNFSGSGESNRDRMILAARRLEGGYEVGGQHTRAGVARILRAVAALSGGPSDGAEAKS